MKSPLFSHPRGRKRQLFLSVEESVSRDAAPKRSAALKTKAAPSKKPGQINTLKELHHLLQKAVELEHSTIPPYLTALYSIPDGTNIEAAKIIKSVVMEEMLHMVLAANVLNAIRDPRHDLGGPVIDHPKFIPEYPTELPVIDAHFKVHLEKFCPHSIETFMKIERPEAPSHPPKDCACISSYYTIGQFYGAIMEALPRLDRELGGIFKGNPDNQVPDTEYYGGGGKIYAVRCLDTAIVALQEIVGQGEGVHHTLMDGDGDLGEVDEVAHYFRFKEILKGRHYDTKRDTVSSEPSGEPFKVDWNAVYPMKEDPKLKDTKGSRELHNKAIEANRTYNRLLHELHKSMNGKPELLMQSVKIMYELKYQVIELMKTPLPNGEGNAGLSFEYVKL